MIRAYKLILEEDEVLEEILEDLSNMQRRIFSLSSKIDTILEKSDELF